MRFQVEEIQANGDGDKISTAGTGIGDGSGGGIEGTKREEQQSGQGNTEEITSPASYVIPYFYQPMSDNSRLVTRKEAM